MFRFVGFLWDATDRTQADIVERIASSVRRFPHWKSVLHGCGVAVFCTDARSESMCAYTMDNQRGIILGAVYRQDGGIGEGNVLASRGLSDGEQERVLNSRGKHLIDAFWGNYVAVVSDKDRPRNWLIKDPTGTLPCLYAQRHGITMIFSCLRDCIDLGLTQLTTNWQYVLQRLATGGFFSDHNSIHEVRQVCRGQAVAIDPHSSLASAAKIMHWNPLTFSEEEPLEDPHAACTELRAAVRAATCILAGSHQSILLRISGGLDSSIVLGCLKNAPGCPNVVGYTYYNPHGSSDERRWARLAMRETRFEHLECPFDPSQIDLRVMLEIEPTVAPAPALMYLTRKSVERRLASVYGCTGVLSGEGGDSSFGSESVTHALHEYLQKNGLSGGALALAARLAVFTDTSVWTTLRDAMRRRVFGSRMSRYTERLLSATKLATTNVRAVLASRRQFPHPWFAQCRHIPWETIDRLGSLVLPPEYYDPFISPHETGMEHLAPLYSQPVVELCLRIPTYIHFANGRDRGLARQAFAGCVPEAILRRQWKDRAPGFAHELAHRNLGFLREVLLDGMLVKERLLDGRATEAVLSGELNKSEAVMPELFAALDVEIWLRSLAGVAQQRIAA